MKTTQIEGFDQVFPIIGGRNRYQWLIFGICSIQVYVFVLHHVGYVYLGAIPDHYCNIEELKQTNWTTEQIKNISIPRKMDGTRFERCKYYDLDYGNFASNANYEETFATIKFGEVKTKPCSKWTYDKSIYESTTVTQFNLVCEREYMVATIQATYMAGALFGSFAVGGLSDGLLGRRRVVLLSIGLVLICGFGAGFSQSYLGFVILRFFIAIGVTTSMQNCFTLMMEYMDSSYRAFIGIRNGITFSIGCMLMSFYAYMIRDWVKLQFAFTASCLILLSYYWILPESSRWLISRGREDEALKILNQIAKINKKPEPDHDAILRIFAACKEQKQSDERQKCLKENCHGPEKLSFIRRMGIGLKEFLGKYLQLVRTKELRRRTFVLWLLIASVSFIYYGLLFGSAILTNDPFLLVFLGALMEIPGYLTIAPFAEKWGRKPIVATIFFLTGAALVGVSLTPFDYPVLRVTFAMTGRLFISACYGVVYVLASELYPTETRATGLAVATLMSRFGSMLAPFVVNQMKSVYTDLPSVIFGVTGIVAGFIALLLPETRGRSLMEYTHAIELSGLPTNEKDLNRKSSTDIPEDSEMRSNEVEI